MTQFKVKITMNTSEYIASGILEMYVTGSLSPEEKIAVEKMAATFPEIKAELTQIENALEDFAFGIAKEPRAELKNEVLNAIKANTAATNGPVVRNLFSSSSKGKEIVKYMLAASVALLLISNFVFFNKWKATEQQLVGLIAQNSQLSQNYTTVSTSYKEANTSLQIASNESFKHVMLKGLKLAPQAKAMVYWNAENKEAYIHVLNLPTPEQGKQYQLWALAGGKPVDAGVFNVSSDGEIIMQRVKNINDAQAFAVTLEKVGGSPSPTMDKMYLLANI